MPDQNQLNNEKTEMRVMWIMSAVVVLIILGMMGLNMLTHPIGCTKLTATQGNRGSRSARISQHGDA